METKVRRTAEKSVDTPADNHGGMDDVNTGPTRDWASCPGLLRLHVPLLSVPDASAGRRVLQAGPGVPCSACPTEEGPGLREDAAGEVCAGGGWSCGEDQPGGQLHHQWVSHRVRAHRVWQLLSRGISGRASSQTTTLWHSRAGWVW